MNDVYDLTLPEAMALLDYWSDYPPAHLLLAARYGHEPKRKQKTSAVEEVEDLGAMFGMDPQKAPGYISDAIAWAEEVKKGKKGWN